MEWSQVRYKEKKKRWIWHRTKIRFLDKNWKVPGNVDVDRTVVERRQPKLTEKGKAYQLTKGKRKRKKLKREIHSWIAVIGTLMGLHKNLEFINEESLKLNDCFKQFGDLHEEIQELLTEGEQRVDSLVYDNLYDEVHLLRGAVQKWIVEASLRIIDDRLERRSSKSGVKTRSSRFSCASTTSSKAKALQAKAGQEESEARIAQLDQVEAARKEAERVKLEAEFAAAAVSKVYEDAIKEDEEQYLGCDETGVREPSLKELSAFITAESKTKNDLVYGRSSHPTTRVGSGFRSKKTPTLKPGNGPPITTMVTEVQTEQNSGTDQQREEVSPTKAGQGVKGDRSQGKSCKVCSGKQAISTCSVFLTKSLNW